MRRFALASSLVAVVLAAACPAAHADPVPVVVTLRAGATADRVHAIERAVGTLHVVRRLHIVPAFAGTATPEQLRALAARPDVANVQRDAPARTFALTAQQSFGIAQARQQIPGLDGAGLVAAVIDTGIDPTLPDLAGKILAFHDLVNGRDEPYDDGTPVQHGTLVSEIIAGSGASGPEGRGVAPAAALVGVKVAAADGASSLSAVAAGIQWAVDQRERYGIDAINLSLGDPSGCGDGTDVASQAIDQAVAAGIVVVAAAGNFGPALCTIKAPGAAESALTVGAMADTGAGGFAPAWISSRGPTADGRTKPDVLAPGVAVKLVTPGGGSTNGYGTSVAAPFVTGTALLMRQANPALSPAQLKDAIRRTAVDWGAPGPDDDSGAGRLDAYAALRAAGASLAVPPAVPGHEAWPGETAESRDVEVTGGAFPLAVTATAAEGAPLLELLDSTGQPVGVPTLAQPGPSRQVDLSLPAPAAGRYTVRVSASGAFTVDVSGALAPADTAAPALTLDSPPSPTADSTPALGGAAGAALGDFPGVVLLVLRGDDVVRRIGAARILGRWSADVEPALPDGAYTVVAEQGDAAGNATRTPPRTLLVDTTPLPQTHGGDAGTGPVTTPPPGPPPACRIALTVPAQRLTAALRRGVRVKLAASRRCAVRLKLTARGRSVGRTVSAGTRARRVTLRLPQTLKRALRRHRRARLKLSATSPGARTVTRRATLKR